MDRLRSNLPQVNYTEESDEDDLEEGLIFNSPLASPQRPPPSRAASPQLNRVEGGPTLADNVDDELETVQWKLHDLAVTREEVEEVTDLLNSVDTRINTEPDCDDSAADPLLGAEFEESGLVEQKPQVVRIEDESPQKINSPK